MIAVTAAFDEELNTPASAADCLPTAAAEALASALGYLSAFEHTSLNYEIDPTKENLHHHHPRWSRCYFWTMPPLLPRSCWCHHCISWALQFCMPPIFRPSDTDALHCLFFIVVHRRDELFWAACETPVRNEYHLSLHKIIYSLYVSLHCKNPTARTIK